MKPKTTPLDRRCDSAFFHLLASSYRRLVGVSLVPEKISDPARWLYEDAPFAVLAHDAAADPVFIYGNRRAQELFEYSWKELTQLPSRLSAESMERAERQQFLDRVARDGFVTGYRGVRVTRSGKCFWIEDATVWDLRDADGIYRGQAARIPKAKPIA
jgi:PAS domain-containing protein